MNPAPQEKVQELEAILRSLGGVLVAFSGGVDSTFLLAAAVRALGPERVLAATGVSPTLAAWERDQAREMAEHLGARHVWVDTHEFDDPAYVVNAADRCYHCKKSLFQALSEQASESGLAWMIEGSNVDDRSDYRPGRKAMAERDDVRSPLMEADLTKADIRVLSKAWGLPTWSKPANACLASRVEYGLDLTPERLRQVEEAEQWIRPFCTGVLRVRHHGDLARIEVLPEDMPALVRPEHAKRITEGLRRLGFRQVALDLSGYRTGSMNEGLKKP